MLKASIDGASAGSKVRFLLVQKKMRHSDVSYKMVLSRQLRTHGQDEFLMRMDCQWMFTWLLNIHYITARQC